MKNVVVTGAGRRLGLNLVKHFLREESQVFAVTRHISKELIELEHDNLKIIEVGEYSALSAKKISAEILNVSGYVDILINNASMFSKDDNQYEALVNVHMIFPLVLSEGLFVLNSRLKPGVIINLTDIYADNPNSDYVLYCATKAGLSNLTMGLAKKLKSVARVMSIAPGPVKFLDDHDKDVVDCVLKQTLIDREGGFEVVLKAIDFIVDNEYLTGTTIYVDGGRSIANF